ncbi:hypothetical protein ACFPL7_03115 [Dongia soli]|uniref:Uncharacterized protein n=1 Tax=Dongia soli TaxID=600628 RepID=A0ABU5EGV5_9PROT|nr:hypothetical protein [Dongia soli]MDY0884720.1 hypothetical protein [Dongia soli]
MAAWKSWPRSPGLEVLASINPPGGSVTLRAERALLLVITACSVDFHPANAASAPKSPLKPDRA